MADWIVAVVAVLALLLSTAAAVFSRRSAQAASSAEAAARRSAECAAGEQMARRKAAREHAIRWTLTRHGAATNELVNIGDHTAYDVRVEVPAGMDILGLPTRRPQMPSGDTFTVGVARSKIASNGGGIIRVLWRDAPDGPDQEWRHPAV